MGKKSKPQSGLILEYEKVFKTNPPSDRLLLLSTTTKLELIGLICQINNILSPRISTRFDYKLETQIKLLNFVLRLEPDPNKKNYVLSFLTGDAILFTRSTNLWAITEILNSNIRSDQEDSKITSVDLWNFLQYYLCINSEANKIKFDEDSAGSRAEKINHSILAFNEYFENVDPIYTLYRGTKLLKYIDASEEYGSQFKEYVNDISGHTLSEYLTEIAGIYFSNHSENDEFRFFFKTDSAKKIFESFSEREYPIKEKNILEALHIRKSPFYKFGTNLYLLLDDKFLIEKSYDLIIWDFLFEKVLQNISDSNERISRIKKFKGFIGYFFESYVRENIERSFHFLKHPKPKLFSDLLVNGSEFGDIYIQKNKRLLIGEVKSSGISSKSKYGETVTDLYNNDREEFFKTHGLNQLVRNIENLFQTPSNYNDKLNFKKAHSIYPVMVTSERILTLGLFIQIFNEEFNKKIDRKKYAIHTIKPLIILHISDLEFLEEYFYNRTIDIFDFLDSHYKKYPIIIKLSMSYSSLSPKHGKHVTQEIISFCGNTLRS